MFLNPQDFSTDDTLVRTQVCPRLLVFEREGAYVRKFGGLAGSLFLPWHFELLNAKR